MPSGEIGFQRGDFANHVVVELQRIGVIELENGEKHGVFAILRTESGIFLGSQFNAGDFAEADLASVLARTDDDVLKFLDGGQAALGVDLELHYGAGEFGADGTCGRLDVLVGDGGGNFGIADIHGPHAMRVEPDAHAVLHFAENHRLADAVDAGYGVLDVDVDVVAEENRGMLRIAAGEGYHGDDVGGAFHHREAIVDHFRRQEAFGALDRVVDVDERHVGVGVGLEGQDKGIAAAVVGGGRIIDHVLDAVDFAFQRRGDRFRDDLGARAGIRPHDHDGGRRNVRVLGDGQLERAQPAGKQKEQGNDDSETRTGDKE